MPTKTRRRLSWDVWMWLLIGAATAAFFWLACRKYRLFNGETNDLTVYSYAFAQTIHGKFFPLYYMPGSLLGNHLNFIILLWLPVYFVWRSFYSLLFFQTAMLTVAAWPFYLLSKHVLQNARAALILAAAFLLFPTIASQHTNQLHDDQFGLPFLMFAFYFFIREDFRKFAIFMVLACLAKETLTLTAAAFGVYALVLRRNWKWIATPILFSGLYLVVAIKLLTGVFAGAGGALYTGTKYFEAYGNSPSEVMNTFLKRPGFVVESMFSQPKMEFLRKLLLPVLFLLPFISLSVLISLPNLLLNLVGTNLAMIVIPWHYNIILGATLLVASVFGIQKITARFSKRPQTAATWIAGATLAGSIFGLTFWFHSEEYRPQAHDATLVRARAQVPAGSSVLCPGPMLAHFSTHPRITMARSLLNSKELNTLGEYDYVILDGNWHNYDALAQQDVVNWIQKTNLFELVFDQQNVYVLRNKWKGS